MSDEKKVFQYIQFKSMVSPDFWYKLAEMKLDVEMLNEGTRKIFGTYTNMNRNNCVIDCDCSAFNREFAAPKNSFLCHGNLMNKNTIEAFKNCDRASILKKEGETLYDDITSGLCLDDPSRLVSFVLLSHADIKSYTFYYWFAFTSSIQPVLYEQSPPQKIGDVFTTDRVSKLTELYRDEADRRLVSFFLSDEHLQIKFLKDVLKHDDPEGNLMDADLDSIYFCFADPSEFENIPGWPLRNFIFMLLKLCPVLIGKRIKVISIRQDELLSLNSSLVFTVDLEGANPIKKSDVKWTGWERNKDGKLLPKIASMANAMDPIKLSEHFSNLNLKLMKWRLLPSLNLDIIKSQKCLLLGAGTLGCAIARNLLSWAVADITFVDSGNVGFSNPTRQCLYKYEDAAKHKPKASTAAERLREIHPSVNASGHILYIQSPGHQIADSMRDKAIENIELLKSLIQSHDVLFLLTDSRESRWLPTLLGAFYGKIVITTALGFDSYLVMRHGSRLNEDACNDVDVPGLKCISGSRLGCYFCNDVTAPGNSMKDRTLDQQCTVTRSGVANISAAIAVELFVSIVQHEKMNGAPAYYRMTNTNEEPSIPEGILGILPHSVRGYLSTFQHIMPATERFSQCVACSLSVLKKFEENGNDFLMKVFDSADYLEEITGIDKMAEIDNDIIDCDDFDIESD